ncbi:nitroreductase/quinone reductase family protein [Streptosporangium lutulentum]
MEKNAFRQADHRRVPRQQRPRRWPFRGARPLLLTTTGARSGEPRTTPLAYLPDGAEGMLVVAFAGEHRTPGPGMTT